MKQSVLDMIREYPDACLPKHFAEDTKPAEIQAIAIAFEFTPDEWEIYNDLCNMDCIWLEYDCCPLYGIYGDGVHYEAIQLTIHYMFNKTDCLYREPYDKSENIETLIQGYKQRMKEKYGTCNQWLKRVFYPFSRDMDDRTLQRIEKYIVKKRW